MKSKKKAKRLNVLLLRISISHIKILFNKEMCSFVKYEIFPYNRTEMSAERRRASPTTAEFLTFEKQRDPSNAESVFVLTPTRMYVSWNFAFSAS